MRQSELCMDVLDVWLHVVGLVKRDRGAVQQHMGAAQGRRQTDGHACGPDSKEGAALRTHQMGVKQKRKLGSSMST